MTEYQPDDNELTRRKELFDAGIFGSGVDLSPLDEATAYRLGALVGKMIHAAVEADRERRSEVERREFAQAHRDDLVIPGSGQAIEPMEFTMRHQVVTWDWREYAPLDDIGRAIEEVSGDRVHLYEVETGNDQFAIVITNDRLDKAQVNEVYHDYLGG
jgi:hypothetical protein